ncbi:hypothetical protein KR200_011704 [Drosophila serrata]|nr:hypothetical protein KR200_011704 [Drosophila serrata]
MLLLSSGKSKLDPNGKCGVAVKQQQQLQKHPSEPPVEAKTANNPIQFLERKTNDELVVHWTRSESSQFPPIKLMPPW